MGVVALIDVVINNAIVLILGMVVACYSLFFGVKFKDFEYEKGE